jgi:hypothetical protein
LEEDLDMLFRKANALMERGRFQESFRLFLRGAQAGDPSCQLNVGYLYDVGEARAHPPPAPPRTFDRAQPGGGHRASGQGRWGHQWQKRKGYERARVKKPVIGV